MKLKISNIANDAGNSITSSKIYISVVQNKSRQTNSIELQEKPGHDKKISAIPEKSISQQKSFEQTQTQKSFPYKIEYKCSKLTQPRKGDSSVSASDKSDHKGPTSTPPNFSPMPEESNIKHKSHSQIDEHTCFTTTHPDLTEEITDSTIRHFEITTRRYCFTKRYTKLLVIMTILVGLVPVFSESDVKRQFSRQQQFQPMNSEMTNDCGDLTMFCIYVNGLVLMICKFPMSLINPSIYVTLTITALITFVGITLFQQTNVYRDFTSPPISLRMNERPVATESAKLDQKNVFFDSKTKTAVKEPRPIQFDDAQSDVTSCYLSFSHSSTSTEPEVDQIRFFSIDTIEPDHVTEHDKAKSSRHYSNMAELGDPRSTESSEDISTKSGVHKSSSSSVDKNQLDHVTEHDKGKNSRHYSNITELGDPISTESDEDTSTKSGVHKSSSSSFDKNEPDHVTEHDKGKNSRHYSNIAELGDPGSNESGEESSTILGGYKSSASSVDKNQPDHVTEHDKGKNSRHYSNIAEPGDPKSTESDEDSSTQSGVHKSSLSSVDKNEPGHVTEHDKGKNYRHYSNIAEQGDPRSTESDEDTSTKPGVHKSSSSSVDKNQRDHVTEHDKGKNSRHYSNTADLGDPGSTESGEDSSTQPVGYKSSSSSVDKNEPDEANQDINDSISKAFEPLNDTVSSSQENNS